MKKLILFSLVMIVASAASAQQPKIKVLLTNGTSTEYNLAQIAQLRIIHSDLPELFTICSHDSANNIRKVIYSTGVIDSLTMDQTSLNVYFGGENQQWELNEIDSLAFVQSSGFFYSSPSDSRLATIIDSNGNTITYFGLKDTSGLPSALGGYTITAPDDSAGNVTVALDSAQRVSKVLLTSGEGFDFSYAIADSIIVTCRDSMGRMAADTIPGRHSSAKGVKQTPLNLPDKPQFQPDAGKITIIVQKRNNQGQTFPIDGADVKLSVSSTTDNYDEPATPMGGGLYLAPTPSWIDWVQADKQLGEYAGKLSDLTENLCPDVQTGTGPAALGDLLEKYSVCIYLGLFFPEAAPAIINLCPKIVTAIATGCTINDLSSKLQSATEWARPFLEKNHHDPDPVVSATSFAIPYGFQSSSSMKLSQISGTITIEYPDCNYSLSASSASFQSDGGSSTVDVTCDNNCTIIAFSSAEWLQITSIPSKPGPGTVGFSATANPDPVERSATITIGDQIFTVTQDASGGSGDNPFEGSYSGTYQGVDTVEGFDNNGNPIYSASSVSGSMTFTVDMYGDLTETSPDDGYTNGLPDYGPWCQIDFGDFHYCDGTIVIAKDGSASGSGTWTSYDTGGYYGGSGTWSVTRQ